MMSSLASLLASLPGLEDSLTTFEEEALTLETLRDMTSDKDDFLSCMEEIGIARSAAMSLHAALTAKEPPAAAGASAPTASAAAEASQAEPSSASSPSDLAIFLSRQPYLQDLLETFEDEELTLDLLKEMTSDEADFISSMAELGIAEWHARRLMDALRPAPVDVSERAGEQGTASGAPRGDALAPPPPDMPDEDVASLVGRRALITGLTARTELNGRVAVVLFLDQVSGRYTVCTEAAEGETVYTVALKPTNLDAEAAKAIPSKKKEVGPGVYVDHAAADAAAKVAAEIAAKEKAEVEERTRAMAKAESELETPERAEMYRKAQGWKQPAAPGSIEAFYREQNRKMREEAERELAEWKARPENAAVVAQMEAKKQMARDGPLGYNQTQRREREALGEVSASPTVPPASKTVEMTPDLASAMAALAAVGRSGAGHLSRSSSCSTAAADPSAAAPPPDLLAAALGKIGSGGGSGGGGGGGGGSGGGGSGGGGNGGGGSGGGGICSSGCPAQTAPHHLAGRVAGGGGAGGTAAQDLLAAALGKAGVTGAVAAATTNSPAKKESARQPAGARRAPLPPHLAAAEERKRQEAAAAAGRNALDAYKRRHYTSDGGSAAERDGGMGEGTVSGNVLRARERAQAAKDEAAWRDKNAFVGEHYNDI